MYETYYKIAEIVIKITSPFPFYTANGEDFRCEPAKPDYCFRFEQVDDIPRLMEGAQMAGDVLWAHEYRREDGSFLRAFLWKEKYYTEVSVMGKREGVCYYASTGILMERAKAGFELLMYCCLEQILLEFGGLVLHSSHIVVDGRGLVFSAPPQTGKSTQAELWRKHAGVPVINGDRSVLRKLDGQWCSCGCPMCGTSGIHLQSVEPLGNIVMLSQGRENIARRLGSGEAFRLIWPQISILPWNADYVGRAMELIDELLRDIPVWHYACTREPAAVTVLQSALGIGRRSSS